MNDRHGSSPANGQNPQQFDQGGYPQNGYPQQGYHHGQPQQGYPHQQGQPQQGYPQQQWQPAPPPKKKNFFVRHKILSALLALILIGIIAGVAKGGSGGGSPSSAPASGGASAGASNSSATPEKKESLPAIGTPVKDGDFQFTVTSVERGVPSVGDQYLGAKAQGSFTLVHVTVKNVGTQTQTMMADGQKAYDAKGIGYEANSSASIYIRGNDTFLTEINPGNELKGVLVFDAPKGSKLTKVRLHESMFSNGVETSL